VGTALAQPQYLDVREAVELAGQITTFAAQPAPGRSRNGGTRHRVAAVPWPGRRLSRRPFREASVPLAASTPMYRPPCRAAARWRSSYVFFPECDAGLVAAPAIARQLGAGGQCRRTGTVPSGTRFPRRSGPGLARRGKQSLPAGSAESVVLPSFPCIAAALRNSRSGPGWPGRDRSPVGPHRCSQEFRALPGAVSWLSLPASVRSSSVTLGRGSGSGQVRIPHPGSSRGARFRGEGTAVRLPGGGRGSACSLCCPASRWLPSAQPRRHRAPRAALARASRSGRSGPIGRHLGRRGALAGAMAGGRAGCAIRTWPPERLVPSVGKVASRDGFQPPFLRTK
jgi:hypothetical protein